MAISNDIRYATIDELYLDPLNPRLGRSNANSSLAQSNILGLMRDWSLDELAVSFLESGFWVQEALLVLQERLYGELRLVVVEGNRRLAALKFLQEATAGKPRSSAWRKIAAEKEIPEKLFERIPYMMVDSRSDIKAFLGFRHVTGIKEWHPAEKAEYIATLIEQDGMTYEQVMRAIGSKTPTVRQNYISYRLLLQMEDQEDIHVQAVEDKFSVLYLSLRTEGVQSYLHIDIKADPEVARRPVPADRLQALARFALWLFGDGKREPLITDSRQVDDFGTILNSPEAVRYLEETSKPSFETAFRHARGDEPELVRLVSEAAYNVEEALRTAHLYTDSERLREATRRFKKDAEQLISVFQDTLEQMPTEH